MVNLVQEIKIKTPLDDLMTHLDKFLPAVETSYVGKNHSENHDEQ